MIKKTAFSLSSLVAAACLATAVNAETNNAYPGANGKPFQALQGQVNDLQSQLDQVKASLQAQIDEASAKIVMLSQTASEHETELSTLNTQLNLLQNQLATLEQTKQDRINGACEEGYAIQEILSDGTTICARDGGNGFKIVKETFNVLPGVYLNEVLKCPASHPVVTGGGYYEGGTVSAVASRPTPEGDGWTVFYSAVVPGDILMIHAICTVQ
jgi:TolA-binding protein